MSRAKREQRLPALVVSRGIGIGRVVFFHGDKPQPFRLELEATKINDEIERFRSALNTSILQLHQLSGNVSVSNQPVSGIFDVQILILESSFTEKIETLIKQDRVNAEWAIRTISDRHVAQQKTVADLNFRDKQLDIEDAASRLLKALNDFGSTPPIDSNAIIVAGDLSPSTIMEIAESRPAGLITELGGWTSHSSILAREFNLPMVSGVRNVRQLFLADDIVVVDGIVGQVIINPTDESVAKFQCYPSSFEHSGSYEIHGAEAITTDGAAFLIRANIDQPDVYAAAEKSGATGIGLYRSESLIRQPGDIPSEKQQFAAYCRIADAVGEHGVKIRTFDVGVERFGSDPHWVERNPSLGLRAIRLSLADPTHFQAQIRAILRASFGRKIDVILPMISGIEEMIRATEIIEAERFDLISAGIDIGNPQLGAMIETPSAVLTAFEIAKNVDFLCLGTNDLVQYLLAVDRDNDAVADWYQTLHPAVIRAISDVLGAAKKANVPSSVCGEMAGSPFYAPILLGLGAREFSMNANSIRSIRNLLSRISLQDAVALVESIKTLPTAGAIEDRLRSYYLKNWADLFPPNFLDSRFR